MWAEHAYVHDTTENMTGSPHSTGKAFSFNFKSENFGHNLQLLLFEHDALQLLNVLGYKFLLQEPNFLQGPIRHLLI